MKSYPNNMTDYDLLLTVLSKSSNINIDSIDVLDVNDKGIDVMTKIIRINDLNSSNTWIELFFDEDNSIL